MGATEFCTEALADCNVATLAVGDIIQFERNCARDISEWSSVFG